MERSPHLLILFAYLDLQCPLCRHLLRRGLPCVSPA